MSRSVRTLIVDDSEEYAISLVREMQGGGYHPIFRQVVEDEAVAAALEERSWDVVIADYSMPRFRAATVLRLLKNKGWTDLPVIVVSSDFGEDVAVAAMKAGAHDYLRKANLPRLIPTIERCLREAEDHRTRRAAEVAQRRAEAQYRDLVQWVHAIVWRADPRSFRFDFVSREAEKILGYPAARWTEPDFWRNHIHPDDRERVMDLLRKTTQQRSAELDYRMVGVDGRVVWLHGLVRVVVQEGQVSELVGIMVDVTRRKLLEEQLRQSQKMEAMGQLAGGVAHDFNNLLSVIMGHADLLLRGLAPEDPRRGRVDAIEKAVDRAASLTRQLLAFSRKQVLQPKVLDLNAEVAELESMIGRLIGEDIELLTNLGSPLGPVRADPGQLQQVVINLAVNARDAMPHGGKLIIETGAAELDETYARLHPGVRPGAYVILAVSDTGSGMDAHTLSRIFEPFFTTKEPGKGTGLGLATVYGIVEQSGGHIAVYSEPGRGSTFRICLPRVEEAVSAAAPEAAAPAPTGSETLLLVEDEAPLRVIVREMLEANGYVVLEAATPEAALEIARAHAGPIHLLVTDVIMPRMNGRELAAAIEPVRPAIPVLYLSGYPNSIVAHYDLLAPETRFLQKPFSSQTLLRKVRETLEGLG